MNPKTFFSEILMMAIMTMGLLFLGSFPVAGSDIGENPVKVHPVGIVTPDGGKSIWLVGDDMNEFLAGYSSQNIEDLKFYQFTTWKDAATFMVAVNQHQERSIRDLAANIQRLTKRVTMLERKRFSATTYPANQRIEALEQKVREMDDGGYR